MTHHFSIDPRSVLGVGDDASMEAIHDAFRDKSKKHHPDVGGDEWAFRMVALAYEILKTTSKIGARDPPSRAATDYSPPGTPWRNGQTDSSRTMFSEGENLDPLASGAEWMADGPLYGSSFDRQPYVTEFSAAAAEFRTIDVELVWIRFELAGDLKDRAQEGLAATTLSVCMILSWPRTSLVKHEAQFPDAADTLRILIESFEQLRGQEHVVSSRSRIEDGQFVGWLSYPNVLQAEAGFQLLRDTISSHGLRLSLRTRDEPLPTEWINR
jgi:curved DNA-binding protein CbpA